MDNADRVEAFLTDHPGRFYCDRCLSDEILVLTVAQVHRITGLLGSAPPLPPGQDGLRPLHALTASASPTDKNRRYLKVSSRFSPSDDKRFRGLLLVCPSGPLLVLQSLVEPCASALSYS